MNSWEEWHIQFEQVYDGGYRYLDVCGEFMAFVREALDFMPTTVNPAGCEMEQPDASLRLNASAEGLSVACWEPLKYATFIGAAQIVADRAIELFQPFEVHQNRYVSRLVWRTQTLEQSNRLSTEFLNSHGQELAKYLNLNPTLQDTAWTFQSGTRELRCRIYPMALNVTASERRLPDAGTPRSRADFLEKQEKRIQKVRPPSYGLGLEVYLIENDPVRGSPLEDGLSVLQKYRNSLTEFLSK